MKHIIEKFEPMGGKYCITTSIKPVGIKGIKNFSERALSWKEFDDTNPMRYCN